MRDTQRRQQRDLNAFYWYEKLHKPTVPCGSLHSHWVYFEPKYLISKEKFSELDTS